MAHQESANPSINRTAKSCAFCRPVIYAVKQRTSIAVSMDMTNPLGMQRHALGDLNDGLFGLPPQQATACRKEYFERGQRILAAYTSIAVYSEKGRGIVESHKKKEDITPTTPIRLEISGFRLQTTLPVNVAVEPVEKVQIPDFLKNFLAIDQRVANLKFFQDGVFLQTP